MFGSISAAWRGFSREAGLRFLLRRKAAFAVAVITMALALGANTAVFSVVKAFLLSGIAVPEADRLMLIGPMRELPGRGSVLFSDAYPNYQLIRAAQKEFADVACVWQGVTSWEQDGDARPLRFSRVTASFFPTMRVFPAIGSAFSESDEGPSPKPVAIISHGVWQSGFGGDSAIVGRAMRLNGDLYTIVGVMPPGFEQPAPSDVWLPFDIPAAQRAIISGGRSLSVYGRIADGRSLEAAVADADALTRRALEANSVDNKDYAYRLQSLRDVLLNGAGSTVLLVQAGGVVLLLLAVLNLALLLVAWGFDRRQEMSVRIALGAGTGRVVRMLFLQSIVVVAAGAALGVAVAYASLPWIRQLDLSPAMSYFVARIKLDTVVLLASAVVAIVAGLVAGVLPAWFNRRADLSHALRSGSRSVTLTPAALRWQQGMVFAQAALSVVILAAAALLGISFRNIASVPGGFDPQDLLVARVHLREAEYAAPEKRVAFGRALLENLSRESALTAGTFTSTLPVSDQRWGGRFFPELPDGSVSTDAILLHFRRVAPNYLETIGIPLLRGRQFTAFDDATAPGVVILSDAIAKRLWPNGDAIGKRIHRIAPGRPPIPLEVVGVVGDAMDAGATSPPGETAYAPYSQVTHMQLSILVRPRGGREEAFAAVRNALKAADPYMSIHSTETLKRLVQQANALPRLQGLLLVVFGVVAIGIVALGSYGVMTQLVANREREYAVRLVFGAAPRALGGAVVRQIALLTIPGVTLGVGAVLLLGDVLRRFVFGIEPRSIAVLGTVAAGMLFIAALASVPSVLRAMRVDLRKVQG